MSYPKKSKGWRNLTLGNKHFRWCFIAQAENSLLKLQGSSSASQQAIVALREWRDPWLDVGQTDALLNEPKVVTGAFASQAVAFALQNGWKPEESGTPICFEYLKGNFVSLSNATTL